MDRMEKAAADFVAAIKEIAGKLESYLSYHFPEWLRKYANTPDGIAAEMKEFASMDI